MNKKIELIAQYYQNVVAANKELPKKEAFKDLLNRLYAGDEDILQIIDKMTKGSETAIVNIPRTNKLHRGSADTLYNNIIIEFENDLRKSEAHAKEQLAGYLLGQMRSGLGYNFTLIVSDCIHWKVVAPDVDCLDRLETMQENELILNEVLSASFTLTENNAEEFYYWIDRFLFKEEKQKASLQRIEEAFGYQSNVFIESFRIMTKWFAEAKKYGGVQVCYEQWKKFLSIAYGSFEATENIFLIHTYLSVFSKLLAYAVVSNDDYIDDDEMRKVLDGSMFLTHNIGNFVDNDFFHWVNEDRDFQNMKKAFRLIAQEISAFDFEQVDEDILKGVYQELIDLDTRHSLGEYYTPDWLCERVVQQYQFQRGDLILDPSCGSGSFLRAAIHRIKELNPDIAPAEINNQIFGIDIHPLSVQIAKTTLLLALGKDITKAKKPVHLNIILANTLLAPEGVKNLFGNDFTMHIDRKKFAINTQVLEDNALFEASLVVCEELSAQSMGKALIPVEVFANALRAQTGKNGFSPQLVESFHRIYQGFKIAKEAGRDTIWKFIVSNLYKPYFLADKFDYIIGNPPWFTYSSVKNEEYQAVLNQLAIKYAVKPKQVANFPHLEIASIFLAYCSNYFLKDSGKLAFVLPRSFFNADHHDNTRAGIATGFKLTEIWDLQDVSPLFRIPSCVLFTEKHNNMQRSLKASGLSGIQFAGRLRLHNCNIEQAKEKLTETKQKWFYATQGKTSAFSLNKTKKQKGENPYKKRFKQGATIVPRAFYFVDLDQQQPDDFEDRIINIKTAKAVKADAKAPWKGLKFSGRIESRFVFRSALTKSILPYALYKPALVVLPLFVNVENGNKCLRMARSSEILNQGYMYASKWFANAERIWDISKTQNNKAITASQYVNWHNKLTDQNLNARFLVLYNASAKDANAMVVDRQDIDLELIVESKAYVTYTNVETEAFYIASFLNSSIPNELMKDFQTRGLFGARDVHKKILDIYFPAFDASDASHIELARLCKHCHTKTSQYLSDNPPVEGMSSMQLGKLRLEIKEHLLEERASIDTIVKRLIG
jgi:type I restriction-modification system DNA methylase subunit